MSAIASSTTVSRGNSARACRIARNWCGRLLQRSRDERGANILEMAFVAIFLFLFIAGIVDLGGALSTLHYCHQCLAEGARTYARLPCLPENRTALHSAIVGSALGEAARSGLTLLAKNVTIFARSVRHLVLPLAAQVRVTVQDDFDTMMGSFWERNHIPDPRPDKHDVFWSRRGVILGMVIFSEGGSSNATQSS